MKINSRRNGLKSNTTYHHFSVNRLFPSSSKALFCKLFVVLALSAASTSAFGANLVSDPGFENGMTGWTTNPSHAWVASTQDVMFGSFDAANGSGTGDCGGANSCLNPTTGAYLYQDLTTTVGQDYTVGFEYYFSGTSGLQELDAYFGGVEIATISVTSNVPEWISFSTDIVAASVTSRLNFVEGNDPAVTYLDNVSVTASTPTPEPSSWANLAGGVAFLLLIGRVQLARGSRRSGGVFGERWFHTLCSVTASADTEG
jgi:hypothetical protein